MSIILRDFNIHVGNKDDLPMLISAGGGAAGNEQHNDDDNGMTCQLLLYGNLSEFYYIFSASKD